MKWNKKTLLTVVDERQDLFSRQRPVLGDPGRVCGVEQHVVSQVGARRGDEVAEVLPFLVGAAGSCFFCSKVFFFFKVFFFSLSVVSRPLPVFSGSLSLSLRRPPPTHPPTHPSLSLEKKTQN